jgi:hypothetical protein
MAPEKLAAALDKLRGGADLVVVKGAPVLATADTVALAFAADVCLLVAEIGRTKRRAVQQAVAALPRRPDLLVAAVPLDPGPRNSLPIEPRHAVKPPPDTPLPSASEGPGSAGGHGTEAAGTEEAAEPEAAEPEATDPTGADGAGLEPAGQDQDQVERDEHGGDERDSDKGDEGEGKTARADMEGVRSPRARRQRPARGDRGREPPGRRRHQGA